MSKQPILGVEDLLGRYRADGETESSGSFTLDPKKAMEKLAGFTLPNKYLWIVKVIQSLHQAEAKTIQVDANVNSVTLIADAVPKGLGDISELMGHLLSSPEKTSAGLYHLAAGLQGSLAVSPSEIRLAVVLDEVRSDYLLQSGGWRDGARKSAPGQANRFELRLIRNLSEKLSSSWFLLNTDIFDLFLGKKSALDRENKAIADKCDFTNCSISLGKRQPIARRFGRPRFRGYDIRQDSNPGSAKPTAYSRFFGDSELVAGLAHGEHHLAEMVVPSPQGNGFRLEPVSHATLTDRLDPAAKTQCLSRAYALSWGLHHEARIHFWEDGVLLGFHKENLGCPGLKALVDARELNKDASTLKVRDDDRRKAIIQEVAEAGQILKQQVLDNLDRMPNPERLRRFLKS